MIVPVLTSLILCWFANGVFADASGSIQLFSKASDVRGLPPDSASFGMTVKLRGIVTYSEQADFKAVFLQDDTSGIYVEGVNDPGIRQGHWLEVEGITGRGVFAPIVTARSWRVLGTKPLPIPKFVSAAEMHGGQLDSQWLEVKGIVRAVTPQQRCFYMELGTGGSTLRIILPSFPTNDIPGLVDSRVRVRGVCFTKRNMNGQWIANYLGVAGPEHVIQEEPAPDASTLPVQPIANLFRFPPVGADGHRVKVQGAVLSSEPGGMTFIQDATQAIQVQGRGQPDFSLGDQVEAVGFLAGGGFYPVMEDAELRLINNGSPVQAQAVTVGQLLSGRFGGHLIQVEARLVDRVQRPDESVLILENATHLFVARLRKPAAQIAALPVGSVLSVTGVCLLPALTKWEHAAPIRPGSFEVLLRDSNDITVLQTPSWWTARRITILLALVTAILIAAIVWVMMLRHRVRIQTRLIESKIQREATLEERTRIARELHDTLTQGVAGIAFQLEAVATHLDASAHEARRHLDLALVMVRHSLADARRSVMNLRAQPLEAGDLPGALQKTTEMLVGMSGVKFQLTTEGHPRRLSTVTENNLLRMGQEAVNNALKYSLAREIQIHLAFKDESVSLRVEDSGKGFDINTLKQDGETHFGLLGMRERARQMNAEFDLKSFPDRGTTITVNVPIN